VWRNFDEISGISFLPYDGGTYRQAPYEECSKEIYESLLAATPQDINWDELNESEDNVEGAQELACSAGACEIR
jgi:ribonucleoside-diphosphate reductase alpha chain